MADIGWPAEPKSSPQWTEGNDDARARVEPLAEEKRKGWFHLQSPPYGYVNWLFYNLGTEWRGYFQGIAARIVAMNPNLRIVGGAFGETLDVAFFQSLKPGDHVFIVKSIDNLDGGPRNITVDNVKITMAHGVSVSAGASGINKPFVNIVSREGIRIEGGWYIGFSPVASCASGTKHSFFGGGIRYTGTDIAVFAAQSDAAFNLQEAGING